MKNKNTTSNNLSLACIVIWKKFDYFNSGISNEFCALMLHRPEDPRDAHYECVKACRLYGALAMIERNAGDADDVFDEKGMSAFMQLDKEGKYGIFTSSKIIENGVQKLATKFSPPKMPMDKDQVAIYPFEEGIIDLMNFDMNNTLKSHATMGHIMCEYGAEQLTETNMSDNSTSDLLKKAREVFAPRN